MYPVKGSSPSSLTNGVECEVVQFTFVVLFKNKDSMIQPVKIFFFRLSIPVPQLCYIVPPR